MPDVREQHTQELHSELSLRGFKLRRVRGADCTTLSIGGEFSLIEPESVEELKTLIKTLKSYQTHFKILGNGSNLLIPSDGISEVVIRLGRGFRFLHSGIEAGTFEVGGGNSLMTLSRELSDKGFSGLEFAGGIPASFGGAVRMNAGAHGGEISSVLKEVTFITIEGEELTVPGSSLPFSYRHSGLPEGAIVVRGVLSLTEGSPEKSALKRSEYLAARKRTQPLTVPSAGSVFRNPSPDNTAGMLLERAGLKGEKVGGVEVSTLHANWIVNPTRSGRSDEFLALVKRCQSRVESASGILLKPEVVTW